MHRTFLTTLALVFGLSVLVPKPADALTFSLSFVSDPTSDIYGVGTTAADFAPFGFVGMSSSLIQANILAAVTDDYLGYAPGGPSPLPAGKQLNINFVTSSSISPPTGHDPEYFHIAIGTGTTGGGFLGQACFECVRTATGVGPYVTSPSGSIVGSVLTDQIASLALSAVSNVQRINLIAGTISHEIGHTLSLPHPSGPSANPGESAFSLMATGAAPSYMPSQERVLDREFSYAEFNQLIAAVGLRDLVSVPEPSTLVLYLLGSLMVVIGRVRRD